jgi:RNase H-fold protein (predicted Holliday junction resolvase)
MGAAKPLVKEINHYLAYLNTDQQKVVLGVVKNFATYEEESWKNEKQFEAEMKKRFKDLETGKDKGITFDELRTNLRQQYKSSKKKKA